MNRVNALVRTYFRRWAALRIISLVVVIGLLIFGVVGLRNALAAPTEKVEQVKEVTYSQSGAFGYSARVTNNDLYGNVTLTEKDTSFLFLGIVESIEGKFVYSFDSDQPVRQLAQEVSIEAELASSNNWSKTIVLVPETVEAGSFTLSFPIDTDQVFELANTIEEQIGIKGNSYNLTIQASVRTTGQTDYGPIDELLTQSMSVTLQPAKITWDTEAPLSQIRYGSISKTVIIPIDTSASKRAWIILVVLVALLASYVVWNSVRSRSAPLAAVEKEARQARKKHEDVMVDVERLPQSKAEEMIMTIGSSEAVISVSSLDELVKVSESLFKPVLHKAEPGKHTYWVIDGLMTYEYVSQDHPVPGGEEPRTQSGDPRE